MLKAQPLDPSFTWRRHRERWTWRSIGLLLAIAAGAGFYAGRLSTASSVPAQQPTALEQQTASASSVAQGQGALQSDAAATASIRSSTINAGTKPAAKDETTASLTQASAETAKAQSTTATEKGLSSPPVVVTNPSTAGKAAVGDASKKPGSKTEIEAAAKANAKTETHKAAADDASPAATTAKRQAKSRSPAHSNVTAAPARRDSVVVRRDDAYVPRRDDVYVPPRMPQAAYVDQRERYDDAESYYGRARLEQPYPDRRYAEDALPPRTYYEDRRDYLRPFQGSRDFREYRRYGGYDDGPYAEPRPVLRPMYGGPSY